MLEDEMKEWVKQEIGNTYGLKSLTEDQDDKRILITFKHMKKNKTITT